MKEMAIRPGKKGQFPDKMPRPDSGWSRSFTVERNARIFPPVKEGVFQRCGVNDQNGNPVFEAMLFRGPAVQTLTVHDEPEISNRLDGKYLWAGLYFQHFGHFVTEGISRLWLEKQIAGLDGIIYIPKHLRKKQEVMGLQRRILDLFGIDLPVIIVDEPTIVSELYVPGAGFGLGPIARGTPEFRAFVSERLARLPASGAERIYISRTQTGGKGKVLLEDHIERNLARSGYRIYHPQEHSLEEQISQYKAATHIVGLDGSAFHMAGFVARPDQHIAMILRRNSGVYYNLHRQIEGFSGRSPDILNALVKDWIRPRHHKPNRHSWGQIDHQRLFRQLSDLGYVDGDWDLPTPDQLEAAVAEMNRRMKIEMRALPVVEPIEKTLEGTI